MFVAEHLAALGVDAGHDVPDCAVFSSRIRRLKDQQDCIAIGRIEKLLLRAQIRNVFFQNLFVLLLRLVHGVDLRRPLFEIDLPSFPHAKVLGIYFHRLPSSRFAVILRSVTWRSIESVGVLASASGFKLGLWGQARPWPGSSRFRPGIGSLGLADTWRCHGYFFRLCFAQRLVSRRAMAPALADTKTRE